MEALAYRVMLLSGAGRAAVAFLAGALAVGALAPFDFFAVVFISFPVLVWLLDGANGDADAGFLRRLAPAFWTGWWFGFGYFLAGLWWIGGALLVEADTFAWALPLAVVGLPMVLAIFYGLAAALARLLWSDGAGRIAALAFCFGLVEWLRIFVLTGFPWNEIAYTLMPVPMMMQSVHILGLAAMNALVVFIAAAPALIATRRGALPGIAVAVVLLAAHLGYGAYVILHVEPVAREVAGRPVVRIVQPSVAQSDRMSDADSERIFSEYVRLSSAPPKKGDARPDLIVWPETAVPFILTENPGALRRIAGMLKPGQVLAAGAVRVEEDGPGLRARYYNSIQVISDKGEIVASADKVHLVPFGEYMPYEGFFEWLGIPPVAMPGGFSAATERSTLRLGRGMVALPLVCYEVIFPGASDARGPKPNFILNVTNDSWYGRTIGPYQHLRQAQIRAVETGLPMVRAGNNGISVVTDAYGRIIDGIRLDGIGTVDVSLSKPNPFEVHEQVKDTSFCLVMALLLTAAIISRKSLRWKRN